MRHAVDVLEESPFFTSLNEKMYRNVYVADSITDFLNNQEDVHFRGKPWFANQITRRFPVVQVPSCVMYRTSNFGIYELTDFKGGEITVHTGAEDAIPSKSLDYFIGKAKQKNIDFARFAIDTENDVYWLYGLNKSTLSRRRFFHFKDPNDYTGGPFGKA